MFTFEIGSMQFNQKTNKNNVVYKVFIIAETELNKHISVDKRSFFCNVVLLLDMCVSYSNENKVKNYLNYLINYTDFKENELIKFSSKI